MDFARFAGMRDLTTGFTARYVSKYSFRSGINYGMVPAFGTFDLTASYRVRSDARILLQASNLYACSGGSSTMPSAGVSSATAATYTKNQKCGFGQRHQEMINMPEVGAIVLAGVRWDIQ
jgi:outer membrane receptor for monomeric catechols